MSHNMYPFSDTLYAVCNLGSTLIGLKMKVSADNYIWSERALHKFLDAYCSS